MASVDVEVRLHVKMLHTLALAATNAAADDYLPLMVHTLICFRC